MTFKKLVAVTSSPTRYTKILNVGNKYGTRYEEVEYVSRYTKTGTGGEYYEPSASFSVLTPIILSEDNVYEIGQQISADTATFKDGVEPVTYKYRWQERQLSSDSWTNGSWTTYDNTVKTVTKNLNYGGQVRLHCQAKDSSETPLTVNTFSNLINVPFPDIVVTQNPVVSGKEFVGETLSSTLASFTGGKPPVSAKTMWTVSTNSSSGFSWYHTFPTLVITSDLNGKYIRSQTEIEDANGNKKWANSTTVGPISYYTIGTLNLVNNSTGQTIYNADFEELNGGNSYTYNVTYSGNLPVNQAVWDIKVRSGTATITSINGNVFTVTVPSGTSASGLSVSVNSNAINETPPSIAWTITGVVAPTFGTLTIDPSGDRVAFDGELESYTPVSTGGNIPLSIDNVTWSCDNAGSTYGTDPIYMARYNNGNANIGVQPTYATPNTNYIIRCTLEQADAATVTETFNIFYRYPVPGPALTTGGTCFWAIGNSTTIDINYAWSIQDYNPNLYFESGSGYYYIFRFPAGAEVKFYMSGSVSPCVDKIFASATTMLEDEGREVQNIDYKNDIGTQSDYDFVTIQLQSDEEYIRFKNISGGGRIWFNGQIGDRQGTINGNPMIYEQSISTRAQDWIDENPDKWNVVIDTAAKNSKSQEIN